MDGNILNSFAELFGVNPLNALIVSPTILAIVAIFKEQFGLQSKANLIVSAGLALVFNLMIYWFQPVPVIVGTLICWVGASGGWAAGKQLAHKVGVPSTHKPQPPEVTP
jgi:hypothetical protein